eukprot:417017-Pleurochrysis_carterae.AAC.1
MGKRAGQPRRHSLSGCADSPDAEGAALPCDFKFGATYTKGDAGLGSVEGGADYLAVWLGTYSKKFGTGFNRYHHGHMLDRVKRFNATAVFYAYLIAMLARHTQGLHDCDVKGAHSLCVHGADFIRRKEALILDTYEHYANETAKRLGDDAQVIWLMEPDWHQYSAPTQRGGGLRQRTMVTLFGRMVARIKRHLPKAKISFDISPWVNDQEAWLRPFLERCEIDYMHTSGGRTLGDSTRVRADANNLVTWREVHRITGKGIIADTGYGVGGARGSADPQFDVVSGRA